MTTISESEPRVARLNRPIPIEIIENDGQDCAWLNLSGRWARIVSVQNLWDIDGHDAGEKPFIRMHFRVLADKGRQLFIFRDLIDGSWYQEITLGQG